MPCRLGRLRLPDSDEPLHHPVTEEHRQYSDVDPRLDLGVSFGLPLEMDRAENRDDLDVFVQPRPVALGPPLHGLRRRARQRRHERERRHSERDVGPFRDVRADRAPRQLQIEHCVREKVQH